MGLAVGDFVRTPATVSHDFRKQTDERVRLANVFIPDRYAEKKPCQGSADVAVSEIS